MTRNQVLRMIELPLSVSVIIGGIRIALVVAIGVVAVGSFIGAPTLGHCDSWYKCDGWHNVYFSRCDSDCYHCNRH